MKNVQLAACQLFASLRTLPQLPSTYGGRGRRAKVVSRMAWEERASPALSTGWRPYPSSSPINPNSFPINPSSSDQIRVEKPKKVQNSGILRAPGF